MSLFSCRTAYVYKVKTCILRNKSIPFGRAAQDAMYAELFRNVEMKANDAGVGIQFDYIQTRNVGNGEYVDMYNLYISTAGLADFVRSFLDGVHFPRTWADYTAEGYKVQFVEPVQDGEWLSFADSSWD